MTIVNVEFRSSGQFGDLVAGVNQVNAAVTRLNASLTATNAEGMRTVMRDFSNVMTSSGQYTSKMVQVTSATEKFGKALADQKLKLKDYAKAIRDHVTSSEGDIRRLARQQTMMQRSLLVSSGRTSGGQLAAQVFTPTGLGNDAATKLEKARIQAQILNKVIADGGTAMINFGKNTQWAGRQLTVGLTVPMSIFATTAAKTFYDFDMQMTRMTKVYGNSLSTMSNNQSIKNIRGQVQDLAKELAGTFGQSISETAGLAADIAATGKEGNDLIESTRQTSRLMMLGEIDRADAMKATLSVQTAFKVSTKDLADTINFLNAVENQTSVSLQDLVTAIPKAGPVIRGLGGTVKDLSLLMVAMKEGGVPAAEAANALKSGLASIINPTQKARDSLKAYNIDIDKIVEDNNGKLIPMVMALKGALDGLAPLARERIIEQIFGKYQFARISAMFNNLGAQGSQTLQVMKLMKASTAELGAVAENEANVMAQSASGKFKRAWESLRADLLPIGEEFLNVGTKVIDFFDRILEMFNELPKGTKEIVKWAAIITALAGPVIMLTGVFANFIGYVIKGFGHMRVFWNRAIGLGGAYEHLTEETIAAKAAGDIFEKTMYNETTAANVLKTAVEGLTASMLEMTAAKQAAAGAVSGAAARDAATIAEHRQMLALGGHVPIGQRADIAHTFASANWRQSEGLSGKQVSKTPVWFGSSLVNQKNQDRNEILYDPKYINAQRLATLQEGRMLVDRQAAMREQAIHITAWEQYAQGTKEQQNMWKKVLQELRSNNQISGPLFEQVQEQLTNSIGRIDTIDNKLLMFYEQALAEAATLDEAMALYTRKVEAFVHSANNGGLGLLQEGEKPYYNKNSGSGVGGRNPTYGIARVAIPAMTTGEQNKVFDKYMTQAQAGGQSMPITAGPAAVKLSEAGRAAGNELRAGAADAEKTMVRGGGRAGRLINGVGMVGLGVSSALMLGGSTGTLSNSLLALTMATPMLQMLMDSKMIAGAGKQWGMLGSAIGKFGKTGTAALGAVKVGAAGLARLVPMLFGPWGIAIAGIGVGLYALNQHFKKMHDQAASAITLTAASAQMLGVQVHSLTDAFANGKKDVKAYVDEIAALADQISKLSDTDTIKVFSDKLKDSKNSGEIMKNVAAFYNEALAAGADPEKTKQTIAAALKAAGQEGYSIDVVMNMKGWSTKRSNAIQENLKAGLDVVNGPLNDLLAKTQKRFEDAGRTDAGVYIERFKNEMYANNGDAQAAFETVFMNDSTLHNLFQGFTEDVNRMNNAMREGSPEAKAYAANLNSMTAEAVNLDGNALAHFRDSVQASADAAGLGSYNWQVAKREIVASNSVMSPLAREAQNFADYINLAKLYMLDIAPAADAAGRALQVAIAGSAAQMKKNVASARSGLATDIANLVKSKPGNKPGVASTPKSSGAFQDPYKGQKDHLDDLIGREHDMIDAINDRKQAEDKAFQAKKAQAEYEKGIYEMQINYREAIANGELGQAAIIKNNIANTRKEHADDKAHDAKQDKYDAQVKVHEARIKAYEKEKDRLDKITDKLRDAAQAMSDTTSSGIKDVAGLTKKVQQSADDIFKKIKGKVLNSKEDIRQYIDVDTRNALAALGISVDDFLTTVWKRYSDQFGKNLKAIKDAMPGLKTITDQFSKDTSFFLAVAKGMQQGKTVYESIYAALYGKLPKNMDSNVKNKVTQMTINEVGAANLNSKFVGINANKVGGMSAAELAAIRNADHTGGYAGTGRRSPGPLKGDEVPSILQKGEWVMQKSAVDRYGPSLMEAINAKRFHGGGSVNPSYHTGGSVSGASGDAFGYNSVTHNTFNVQVLEPGATAEEIAAAICKAQTIKEQRKGVSRRARN